MTAQVINDLETLKKAFQIAREEFIRLGRAYAPEYVDILSSHAFYTVWNWLKANNVPQPVIDLLSNANMLTRLSQEIKHNELNDYDAEWLAQEVPFITEIIAQLGGVFSDGESENYPRENILKWEPANK